MKKEKVDQFDRLFKAMSFIGLFLIVFLLGSMSSVFQWYPYPLIAKAAEGIKAQHQRSQMLNAPAINNFYFPIYHQKRGVTINEDSAFDGYTFFTSGHSTEARLVDMDGNLVHSWNLPFSAVWDNPEHVANPVGDEFMEFRNARLLPDGSVYVLYEAHGDTPYGYGFAKLDVNSNLVWKFSDQIHHDIDIGPDGTIYTLSHKYDELKNYMDMDKEVIVDEIVVISPDGKELDRISIMKAIFDSDFSVQLDLRQHKGDIIHCNVVKYITKEQSEVMSIADEGDLLVSVREADCLLLIDGETKLVKWTSHNIAIAQHDPDVLENGNILIFDNRGHFGEGGESRLIEYNPLTGEIPWMYTGTRQQPFYSWIRGDQDTLPNGNIMITESGSGRIFEITRSGEIVWEYHNPERIEYNEIDYVAVVNGSTKFAEADLPFLSDLK